MKVVFLTIFPHSKSNSNFQLMLRVGREKEGEENMLCGKIYSTV